MNKPQNLFNYVQSFPFLILIISLFFNDGIAQSVGINDDGSSPEPGHILDVKSANKGILIPRVTLVGEFFLPPVNSAIESTLVYNIGGVLDPGFYFWTGTAWDKISSQRDGGVPQGGIILSENDVGFPGYSYAGFFTEVNNYDHLGQGTGAWITTPVISTGYQSGLPSCVSHNGKVVVWSGQDNSFASYSSDGSVYDLTLGTWSDMTTSGAPTGRYGHATILDVSSSAMVVWGGVISGDGVNASIVPTNTGAIYNINSNNWTNLSGSPLSARCFVTGVSVSGGQDYIFWGGTDGNGIYYNDGARINAGGWNLIAQSPLSTRSQHRTEYGMDRMFIFGGRNASTVFGDGAMYNPALNSWTMMSSTGAPSPRYDHAMVWTGTHLLVWGGRISTATTARAADGAIFDPITNSWTPMATIPNSGISALRVSATAYGFLNGEFIIAGGSSAVGLSDVARAYNPTSDTWRYIAPLPTERTGSGFTVTTDGRFFIASGQTGFNFTSTSFILDPTDPNTENVDIQVARNLFKFKKD